MQRILLGLRTNTDDLSGRVLERGEIDVSIDRIKIKKALQNFIGSIQQTPPLYSAVHHKGQRLHHVARLPRNIDATAAEIASVLSGVKQRDVQIEKIELIDIKLPVISLRITCSSGTYIRSLARDLGELLGCGACLKFLRREKSGLFDLGQSIELDAALHIIEQGNLGQLVIPPQDMLKFKIIRLDAAAVEEILNGRYVDLNTLAANSNLPMTILHARVNEKVILVCNHEKKEDQIVALGRIAEKQFIKPEVVLLNPVRWQDSSVGPRRKNL